MSNATTARGNLFRQIAEILRDKKPDAWPDSLGWAAQDSSGDIWLYGGGHPVQQGMRDGWTQANDGHAVCLARESEYPVTIAPPGCKWREAVITRKEFFSAHGWKDAGLLPPIGETVEIRPTGKPAITVTVIDHDVSRMGVPVAVFKWRGADDSLQVEARIAECFHPVDPMRNETIATLAVAINNCRDNMAAAVVVYDLIKKGQIKI